MRTQRGEAEPFNPHRLEYAYLARPKLDGSILQLRGEAFVTGLASSTLQPVLKLQNQKSGTIVASVTGRRCLAPRLNEEFGFGQSDYTDGGFEFEFDLKDLMRSGAIDPPCRLSVVLQLVAPDGTTHETSLRVRRRHRPKGRTLLRYRGLVKNYVLAVIAEEKTDGLVLAHRPLPEVNRLANVIRARVARLLFLAIGKRSGRTWVLYETHGATAQDNAYHFFRYMIAEQRHQKVRYVLRRDSADWPTRWAERRRVIPMYSFRHFWALLRAGLLVSSQSRFHGYQLRAEKTPIGRLMLEKKFVFLQHGVISLKRIFFHRRNVRVNADLFLSSTRAEQEIICREYGYETHEVPLTGLPRFDALEDKSAAHRYLLIMPTWREWLKDINGSAFAETEFFSMYGALLRSPELRAVAAAHGLKIKFYLHYNLQQFLAQFKELADDIDYVEQARMPVNELLMRSSVLITDYSSVVWDFYQMRKPAVFYHFDLETYQKHQGSFLDLPSVFGRVSAAEPSRVAALVDTAMDKRERLIPPSVQFEHYDRRNSERVYHAIMDLMTSTRRR